MADLDALRRSRQIENRNFLSPTGFRFLLRRSPQVAFFCQQANVPSLDLGIAQQTYYLKDVDIPGDKIVFGDLNIKFLVDEDLGNYMELQNWIRGLGFPESLKEFDDLDQEKDVFGKYHQTGDNIYSDGTLQVLSNNLVPKFQIFFDDLFPYSLTTLSFDATDTDVEYFTAEASFKYTIYNIQDMSGNSL